MAKMGRPLLYDSVEKLEKDIQSFFDSCFEMQWFDEQVRCEITGEFERHPEKGTIITKPVQRKVNVKPLSITGLAVHLETSRQTLINYESKEDFFDTIKRAKAICEQYVEDGMFEGKFSPVVGIFNAKNNYGWEDKTVQDQNVKKKVTKIVINRVAKPELDV